MLWIQIWNFWSICTENRCRRQSQSARNFCMGIYGIMEVNIMRKIWMILLLAACLLTGCNKDRTSLENTKSGYREDISPKSLVEAVASELSDEYWADAVLEPELLDDWYGVSEEMYEEFYGQTPMISAQVDSLIVIKAREEKLEDVQNALNTYREAMIQDTLQYPMNVPKIQASRISTFGKYVCFVQLGGSMEGIENDDEAAIEACRKMNEQALSVIEGELKQ